MELISENVLLVKSSDPYHNDNRTSAASTPCREPVCPFEWSTKSRKEREKKEKLVLLQRVLIRLDKVKVPHEYHVNVLQVNFPGEPPLIV